MQLSQYTLFPKSVENLDKFLHRFLVVFEVHGNLNPHSALKRPISKKRKQSHFFQKTFRIFQNPSYFPQHPILAKTKRDIGKIKRDIGEIKRGIGKIKRGIGKTSSPLPRGGRAANWDKIAPENSPIRVCGRLFRESACGVYVLSARESAIWQLR